MFRRSLIVAMMSDSVEASSLMDQLDIDSKLALKLVRRLVKEGFLLKSRRHVVVLLCFVIAPAVVTLRVDIVVIFTRLNRIWGMGALSNHLTHTFHRTVRVMRTAKL